MLKNMSLTFKLALLPAVAIIGLLLFVGFTYKQLSTNDERLVLLYTYETDLSDGWEDQRVHNDPEEKRQQALKMGANILYYVYTH